MPSCKKNSGFTLIELIVVISLFSILLVFAVPRIPSFSNSSTNETALWLILNVKDLKERALQDQTRYFLNFDITNGIIWISDEFMDEEEDLNEEAQKAGHYLPDGLQIVDIEFPEMGIALDNEVQIRFFKKGYSDKAFIHMEDENNQYSFLIEPFLSKVIMYDTYKSFNN